MAGSETSLEPRTPDGAFREIETLLRGHGFFAPGGEGLTALGATAEPPVGMRR